MAAAWQRRQLLLFAALRAWFVLQPATSLLATPRHPPHPTYPRNPSPPTCPTPLPARRQWQIYRRALPGLNASAVGLIVASVFQLTLSAWSTSPFPTTSICIGMLVYGATEVLSVPAPFAVVGGGVIGIIGWAANMV